MKLAAVIAEYNPFHQGHQYQLEEIRKRSDADAIVVLMSGDFVQRGAPALLDKYSRASLALSGGADLVIELPTVFALGSARYFSLGALSILNRLPIDYLCFGTEEKDPAKLKAAGDFFAEESPAYQKLLQEKLREGLSFPAARAKAASSLLPEIYPGLFSDKEALDALLHAPNNILAISYLTALKQSDSSIKELSIPRKGSGYHEESLLPLASASAVRKLLFSPCPEKTLKASLCQALPAESAALLLDAKEKKLFQSEEDYLSMIHYALLCADSVSLQAIEGVNAALASRLQKKRESKGTYFDLISSYSNRSTTSVSVSRILFRLLLQIPKDLQEEALFAPKGCYAHILGVRKDSLSLLSYLKEKADLPLIINPSSDCKKLSSLQSALFEKDIFASSLYQTVASSKSGLDFPNDYQRHLLCK